MSMGVDIRKGTYCIRMYTDIRHLLFVGLTTHRHSVRQYMTCTACSRIRRSWMSLAFSTRYICVSLTHMLYV